MKNEATPGRSGLPRLLLCFAVLPGFVAGLSAQEAVVVRSLEALQGGGRQNAQAPVSALELGHADGVAAGAEVSTEVDGADWVEALLTERHAAAIEAGRLRLATNQGAGDRASLVLAGDRAAVEACQRDLDDLIAVAGRTIEVTVHWLPAAGPPARPSALPPAVWRPDELAQAIAGTPPTWTVRARARSGQPLRLGREQWHNYVRDVDAEVAERAAIWDPRVDFAFEGQLVALVAHELPDERILLVGHALVSERLAAEDARLGEGMGSVLLPHHRTAVLSLSGACISGGALVLGGHHGGSGFVLVVAARYVAPPVAVRAPDLFAAPVGAWSTRARVLPAAFTAPPWPSSDPVSYEWRAESGFDGGVLDVLLGCVEGGRTQRFGGLCVVNGDAVAADRVRRVLATLAGQLEVAEVRTWAGEGDAAVAFVQPVLAGDVAAAFVGEERAVVHDYDVEIAARSTAATPRVSVLRPGLFAQVRVAAAGSACTVDGLWLDAALEVQTPQGFGLERAVRLDRYTLRRAPLPWTGPVVPGADQELGHGVGEASRRVGFRVEPRPR
jgi:hypothetical protein